MTSLSNPYLSQVERGLHQPSVRVLKLISDADRSTTPGAGAEAAILADQGLTDEQKNALITVYRSMLRSE